MVIVFVGMSTMYRYAQDTHDFGEKDPRGRYATKQSMNQPYKSACATDTASTLSLQPDPSDSRCEHVDSVSSTA
jgi:hypothetical protein